MDVHKKFVVAAIALTDYRGVTSYVKKRFATFNSDLNSLKKWLLSFNCTEICLESTGKYWISIFNILEDSCHVVVANPKYVRAIKGQKTFDIVPSSYIPCKEIRMLRELFRYRQKLIGHRSSEKNRLQNDNTGTREGLIGALTEMRGYLEPDETELLTLTDSTLEKLSHMSDEAFDAMELYPDFGDEEDMDTE